MGDWLFREGAAGTLSGEVTDPGQRAVRGLGSEIRASVVRLVDGRTRADRKLRAAILLSVAIVGAWIVM